MRDIIHQLRADAPEAIINIICLGLLFMAVSRWAGWVEAATMGGV